MHLQSMTMTITVRVFLRYLMSTLLMMSTPRGQQLHRNIEACFATNILLLKTSLPA